MDKAFDTKVLQEMKESFISIVGENHYDLAIVMGSGFVNTKDYFTLEKKISFADIKHFPKATVVGHDGAFYVARYEGKTILIMQGRIHIYEDRTPAEVTFGIHLMHMLGISNVILTNAAGGINFDYKVGDIVMIEDQINMTALSPLFSAPPEKRFIDMSHAYDTSFYPYLKEKYGIKKGIYVGTLGPQYETPAEIRFFRSIGGDLVGMSTVLEAICASYYQMRVIGISMVTNSAAGVDNKKLSHKEVLEEGKKAEKRIFRLLQDLVSKL